MYKVSFCGMYKIQIWGLCPAKALENAGFCFIAGSGRVLWARPSGKVSRTHDMIIRKLNSLNPIMGLHGFISSPGSSRGFSMPTEIVGSF